MDRIIEEVSERPAFNTNAKNFARLNHNEQLNATTVTFKTNLNHLNAAMPHRMSWKDIRDNTAKFVRGDEDQDAFLRWTGRFVQAGEEKYGQLGSEQLQNAARKSHQEFLDTREAFMQDRYDEGKLTRFEKSANQYFANVPDLGPHKGVNNVVGERAHLNVIERGRTMFTTQRHTPTHDFSPMSRRVLDMSPGRLSGVAVTSGGELIDVRGKTHKLDTATFSQSQLDKITEHRPSTVRSFLFNPGPFGK